MKKNIKRVAKVLVVIFLAIAIGVVALVTLGPQLYKVEEDDDDFDFDNDFGRDEDDCLL